MIHNSKFIINLLTIIINLYLINFFLGNYKLQFKFEIIIILHYFCFLIYF